MGTVETKVGRRREFNRLFYKLQGKQKEVYHQEWARFFGQLKEKDQRNLTEELLAFQESLWQETQLLHRMEEAKKKRLLRVLELTNYEQEMRTIDHLQKKIAVQEEQIEFLKEFQRYAQSCLLPKSELVANSKPSSVREVSEESLAETVFFQENSDAFATEKKKLQLEEQLLTELIDTASLQDKTFLKQKRRSIHLKLTRLNHQIRISGKLEKKARRSRKRQTEDPFFHLDYTSQQKEMMLELKKNQKCSMFCLQDRLKAYAGYLDQLKEGDVLNFGELKELVFAAMNQKEESTESIYLILQVLNRKIKSFAKENRSDLNLMKQYLKQYLPYFKEESAEESFAQTFAIMDQFFTYPEFYCYVKAYLERYPSQVLAKKDNENLLDLLMTHYQEKAWKTMNLPTLEPFGEQSFHLTYCLLENMSKGALSHTLLKQEQRAFELKLEQTSHPRERIKKMKQITKQVFTSPSKKDSLFPLEELKQDFWFDPSFQGVHLDLGSNDQQKDLQRIRTYQQHFQTQYGVAPHHGMMASVLGMDELYLEQLLQQPLTFAVEGHPFAYTVLEKEEGLQVMVHELDRSCYVKEGSLLDQALSQQFAHPFSHENPFEDWLRMKENECFAALTCSFSLPKQEAVSFFPSFVTYTKTVLKSAPTSFGYPTMEEFASHMDFLVNQAFMDYFRVREIPFLYYGSKEPFVSPGSSFASFRTGMNSQERVQFDSIFTNNHPSLHYSSYPENRNVSLPIMGRSDYLGVFFMRYGKEFMNPTNSLDGVSKRREELKAELERIIERLNASIGYGNEKLTPEERWVKKMKHF